MLENLKDLVAINSSCEADEIVEYLKNKFIPISEEIIVIENKKNLKKNIIIGLNTKLKDVEPIVLSGHIDTVEPDYEKYNTNPFQLTVVDDKAYGVGSIDMKSFAAVILDNAKELKCLSPIVIALTTDEETELEGVTSIIEKFKELNIRPKFTIVGEPTKSQINNVSNGCYEFEVEAFGKACHSSILNQGINAICVLAKLITFIEENQKKYNLLTSNCGIIYGGDIVNRVPDYCKLTFDVRSVSKAQVDKFLNEINNKIKDLEQEYNTKIEIKKTLGIPPLQAQNCDKIFALAKEFNLKVEKFMGGCEAGYYQELSGGAIIFGVGDMALAHKPNEYVNINEYFDYSKMLIKLINKIKDLY